MVHKVGFVNQKGGAGKTTGSLAFAAEAAENGKKVLVIDCDRQLSLIGWLEDRAMDKRELPKNLDIVAAPTKAIHTIVDSLSKGYDLVVMDGPPRSTDVTMSIIYASDLIVVPCTASGLDLRATYNTLKAIKELLTHKPDMQYTFLINRKPVNTNIGKEIRNQLAELDDSVNILNSEISMRVIFAEAISSGSTVQEVEKDGKAREEITEVYKEIMGLLNEKT